MNPFGGTAGFFTFNIPTIFTGLRFLGFSSIIIPLDYLIYYIQVFVRFYVQDFLAHFSTMSYGFLGSHLGTGVFSAFGSIGTFAISSCLAFLAFALR